MLQSWLHSRSAQLQHPNASACLHIFLHLSTAPSGAGTVSTGSPAHPGLSPPTPPSRSCCHVLSHPTDLPNHMPCLPSHPGTLHPRPPHSARLHLSCTAAEQVGAIP